MQNILNTNGLVLWDETEIKFREYATSRIAYIIEFILKQENKAWDFRRIESSCLIPTALINPNYDSSDYFSIEDSYLALRPETTAVSYRYAETLLKSGKYPPICIWQIGKSFRNEQDQVTKNMRLKEFHQLEFQCIFSTDTKNDYMEVLLRPLANVVTELLGMESRIVASDRLPSYSEKTMDIEVNNGDKWMEVASISLRNDFDHVIMIGKQNRTFKVLEVAFGMDRLVYNRFKNSTQ